MKNTANKSEVYENWRPQILERGGIFEECATPYNIKQPILLKKDLKKLQEHDGGIIFNSFAEILRRNVVSDKSNAYNKIFNLLLCYMVWHTLRIPPLDIRSWSYNYVIYLTGISGMVHRFLKLLYSLH